MCAILLYCYLVMCACLLSLSDRPKLCVHVSEDYETILGKTHSLVSVMQI